MSGISTTEFSSLQTFFAPLLIGTLLSAVLWGVTCVQTYDYFMNPRNEDPLPQKLIIAGLCILDTFDTAINTHVLYYYFVLNFTNPEVLLVDPWSLSCRSLLTSLSCFIVRAIFARRIYLLSGKSIMITLWIMTLSMGNLVMGTLITVKMLMGVSTPELQGITRLLYSAFSLGVASDVSVAIALCWLLQSVKTGIRRTDTLVKVLMTYIVTTGLLVAVDASLGLIFYILMPNNLIYLGFFLLLGKLYINAYFASLNARESLRKNQTDVVVSLSRMSYQTRQTVTQTAATADKRPDNAMAIAVQTFTETSSDYQAKNSSSYNVA